MSLPAAGTEKTRSRRHRQKFEGHMKLVFSVIHLPGGQRIITCSDDGSLRVWNLVSGEQIGDDWRDGESGVFTIALSPNGKKIVSGSRDGWLRLWDIGTGKLIIRWMAHTDIISSLCWSQDGGRVVTGSYDRMVRVWNVESRKTILEIKTGRINIGQPVAIYSPDETMIATSPQFLKIWDAKTGKLIINLEGHGEEVASLAWTADGSILISGSHDNSIRMWDTTTWQQKNILTGHTSTVEAIAISPNGRILASASQDKTARLWNLYNGQPIGLPIQHADLVFCVSFSADGKLLASGCGPTDHSAYTWDISAIVREAGLDELLLNPNDGDKSLLDAHATRRLRQQSGNQYTYRLPPRFLDESPDHPNPSGRRVSPPSALLHHVTRDLSSRQGRLLDRISSLFRRSHNNSHGMVSRSTVVDVPFAKGKRRNISGAEKRLEKEKARNAKNASASSSRPSHTIIIPQSGGADPAQSSSRPHHASVSFTTPATVSAAMTSGSPQTAQSSITQQFGAVAHIQSTSRPHAAVSVPSTTPAIATTSTTARPDLTIRQAGCWTHFWLTICCASPEYNDDRH